MSKLGLFVAVTVVSLGASVGAWYYKYQLYGWLPSTASSELKNVNGLLMDKEGKPFTGRVKDVSDSGYSLYAYKDLYGWLPSTASSELKNVNGLLMDKEGKPFTGRVKDVSDSGYSLYAYKDGKLDGLNVVFSEGQLREIGHWENGEQNGLFEAWTEKGVLVDHGIFKDGERDGETVQY